MLGTCFELLCMTFWDIVFKYNYAEHSSMHITSKYWLFLWYLPTASNRWIWHMHIMPWVVAISQVSQVWVSVACRGFVMPVVTAWFDAPLPNSSIEQWHRPMVGIVTGYTMFVTSQYDVIFTFPNQRFGEVCWHNMHIQGRRTSSRAGKAIKLLRAMETYKRNSYQLCLFLFINNVDLKNNNRNYRKSFWIIWVPE